MKTNAQQFWDAALGNNTKLANLAKAALEETGRELDRLRRLLDEQKDTIAALNVCIGGEGSSTTENLVGYCRQLEAVRLEREACAAICRSISEQQVLNASPDYNLGHEMSATVCRNAILQRNQT